MSLLTRSAIAMATLAASSVYAATYYVNPSTGNDGRSGSSDGNALKTLARANALAVSGDTVWLAPGKTFDEKLVVQQGVTYDTYFGFQPKAIIRASRDVGSLFWSRLSPTAGTTGYNIWVATTNSTVESGAVSQVFFKGAPLTRARVPNLGKGDFSSKGIVSNYAKVTGDPTTGDQITLNVDNKTVPGNQDVKGATAYVRTVFSEVQDFSVDGWKAGSSTSLAVTPLSTIDFWFIHNPYAIVGGVGYWLENKLWMLDTPGEWFFDAASHKLYVWLPSSTSPAGQDVRVASEAGVVAENVSNFKLSNLQVTETLANGLSLVHTSGATLNKLVVSKAGLNGLSMPGSDNNVVNASTFDNNSKAGIWLGFASGSLSSSPPYGIRLSTSISITNNVITNSGRSGFVDAAARLGEGGVFSGNTINNTPANGLVSFFGTRIENNVVLNSCTGFDDCGGIYVAQPMADKDKLAAATGTEPATSVLSSNNMSVINNIVDVGTGSLDGMSGATTDTRGIYLDDFVNGVTVSGNYVSGMTYGVMLHTAFNNTLNNNLLVNNRSTNLLMQQDAVPTVYVKWTGSDVCAQNPADARCQVYDGQLKGNAVNRNALLASKSNLATVNVVQMTRPGQTSRQFGTFDYNNYATLNPVRPNIVAYSTGVDASGDMPLAAWQAISNDLHGSFIAYKADGEGYGFYNANSTGTISVRCPTSVTSNCSKFTNLKTGKIVSFPVYLGPKASVILVR